MRTLPWALRWVCAPSPTTQSVHLSWSQVRRCPDVALSIHPNSRTHIETREFHCKQEGTVTPIGGVSSCSLCFGSHNVSPFGEMVPQTLTGPLGLPCSTQVKKSSSSPSFEATNFPFQMNVSIAGEETDAFVISYAMAVNLLFFPLKVEVSSLQRQPGHEQYMSTHAALWPAGHLLVHHFQCCSMMSALSFNLRTALKLRRQKEESSFGLPLIDSNNNNLLTYLWVWTFIV